MGMGLNAMEFFNRSISRTIGSVHGRRMAELGDQMLWDIMSEKDDGRRVWAKDWFEAMGCHHYSIDIHGKNGSHPLDLSKSLNDPFWHDNFDIVTNVGTSEHVDDQYQCWQNIHNLGRHGCVYIHIVPEIDRYRTDHCEHWYDAQFFKNLISFNKYTKVLIESISGLGHIGCCYIKPKKREFLSACEPPMSREDFLSFIKRADNV
jgi:hypothetical protein